MATHNIAWVFDTHCHLTDLDDGPSVLRETRARGVEVLCCGYDIESCRLVAGLRELEPGLAVAYGLHPWFADQPLTPVLDCIESARIAAVGEIGLDLLPRANLPAPEQQRRVLEAQLEVAKALGLPVSLHSRRAVEPLIAALRIHPGVTGVCHAFSGSVEQARVLLRMGLLIGVGGGVTRPNAQRIRRLVRELPLDSFVLETDCPAIGIEGLEKTLVRPWDVARVAATVADLKSVTVEAVEEVTDRNAARLFRPVGSQKTP